MGWLILFVLNLFTPFAALGVVLFFFFSSRRKLLKNLFGEVKERFVFSPVGQRYEKSIWIHAASVGEVRSVSKLAALLKEYYGCHIIITTSTAAGRATAYKDIVFDKALLAPVDCYPLIKRFIRFYKPSYLFVVESDLWPNMLTACIKNGIKTAIINGRLSQRSAKRYKLLSPLVKMILSGISFICAQTEEIRLRYISCGGAEGKVYTCGNIKYDMLNDSPARSAEVISVLKKLGWENSFTITCGSTHEEEETVIINAAKQLNDVKFIIAPRHLERTKQIVNNLKESGIKFAVLSTYKKEKDLKECNILLADAMGWLGSFYQNTSAAFVGGSISRCGGHNFLEAAIFSKPVLFGKYYYNTPDVAAKLLSSGGGILVDENNFAIKAQELCKNNSLLISAGKAAGQCALSFKGATEKTLKVVEKYGK